MPLLDYFAHDLLIFKADYWRFILEWIEATKELLFFAGDYKVVCLSLIHQEIVKMQTYYDSHRDMLDKIMLHQHTFKDYIEMEVEFQRSALCFLCVICVCTEVGINMTGGTSYTLFILFLCM